MVFQLARLGQSEGGEEKAWCYTYEGQVYDSSTPKQVGRGCKQNALVLYLKVVGKSSTFKLVRCLDSRDYQLPA